MNMPAVGRVLYRLSKPGEALAAGARRSDPRSCSATRYAELGFYLTTNTGTRLRGFGGRSVYKTHLLVDADEVTFVLTSGEHNAGIVSEPGHPHRSHRLRIHHEGETYIDPDTWPKTTPTQDGSWRPAWLSERSTGKTAATALGCTQYPALADAPGTYILEL